MAILEVMRLSDRRTELLQRAFLTAYRSCGQVKQAARVAGVDPSTHYRWLSGDDKYTKAYEGARHYYERRRETAVRLHAAAVEYDLVCPVCWAYREIKSRLLYIHDDDIWECPLCKCRVSSPDDNLQAIKEDMLAIRDEPDNLPPWRSQSPHYDRQLTLESTRRLHPGGGGKSGRRRKKPQSSRKAAWPGTLA